MIDLKTGPEGRVVERSLEPFTRFSRFADVRSGWVKIGKLRGMFFPVIISRDNLTQAAIFFVPWLDDPIV